MKLILTKIITCLSICSIVFSSIVGIKASAYESEGVATYLETCSALYFSSLKSNFGRNIQNSCGYVAAAMLLSYYDSYWNDSIIPSPYDSYGEIDVDSSTINYSPGIKAEASWTSSSTFPSYHDFIDDNSDEFLHLRLLQIGRDVFNYETLFSTDWAISTPRLAHILSYYLYQEIASAGISSDMITVNYVSYNDYSTDEDPDETMRDMLISRITNGTPVIYLGFDGDSALGHFMIAYDYDEENDNIYFHSGWHNSGYDFSSLTIINERNSQYFHYDDRIYLIWLEINEDNYPHSCAYNYTDSSSVFNYCMCALPYHPYHTHTKQYTGFTSSSHTYECKWCNHTDVEAHNYSYSLNNNLKHNVTCYCGFTKTEPHTWGTFGGGAMSMCVICGAQAGLINPLFVSSSNITYITENGSYIRQDNSIVLSEVDTELYLSGLLDLNDIYSSIDQIK